MSFISTLLDFVFGSGDASQEKKWAEELEVERKQVRQGFFGLNGLRWWP